MMLTIFHRTTDVLRVELENDAPNGARLCIDDARAVARSGPGRSDGEAAGTPQHPQPDRGTGWDEFRLQHEPRTGRDTAAHLRFRLLLLLTVVAVGSLWPIVGLHCTVRLTNGGTLPVPHVRIGHSTHATNNTV
uniref:Uncharacterized protein n=1 Tax=Anopheles melas TaxID=34690 RepID=A0A182TKP8_9DIPT